MLLIGTGLAQGPLFLDEIGWPIGDEGLSADITSDGVPESILGKFFTSNTTAPVFSYRSLHGSGSWSQSPPQIARTEALGTWCRPLIAADFDGDGHTDVFVTRWVLGWGPNALSDILLLGDGMGGMTDASARLPSTPTWLQSGHALDIEGDGDMDLFLCGTSGYHLFVNQGGGWFVDETASRLPAPSYEGAASVVVDADLDGRPDIFVANGISRIEPSLILWNRGGSFSPLTVPTAPSLGVSVLLVDVDRDGDKDVIQNVVLQPPAIWLAAPGVPTMVAAPQYSAPWPSVFYPQAGLSGPSRIVADWDGDEDDDVILDCGRYVLAWENTNQGFVDVSNRMPQPTFLQQGHMRMLDYDLDGDTDILVNVGSFARLLSGRVREARTLTLPTRGGTYVTEFTARSNHTMLAVLGIAPANFHIPNLGWVFLDPAQSAFVGALHFPTHTDLPLSIAVPNLPVLQGFAVGMQGLDIDLTTGAMHTTDRPSAIIQ